MIVSFNEIDDEYWRDMWNEHLKWEEKYKQEKEAEMKQKPCTLEDYFQLVFGTRLYLTTNSTTPRRTVERFYGRAGVEFFEEARCDWKVDHANYSFDPPPEKKKVFKCDEFEAILGGKNDLHVGMIGGTNYYPDVPDLMNALKQLFSPMQIAGYDTLWGINSTLKIGCKEFSTANLGGLYNWLKQELQEEL